MTRTKLLTIICLCILVGLAGCDTTDRPAQVTIHLEHASAEGEQVDLDGNVTLTGRSHNVTLHEVQLRFVWENGSTMRTIPIGTVTAEGFHFTHVEFNATVAEPPEELRLRIGTVEKPATAELNVKGRRLEDEDELIYSPFWQDEY
jgi:hypothetical protein